MSAGQPVESLPAAIVTSPVRLVVRAALVGFPIPASLLHATPYLVVLRDDGVIDAARRSYGPATDGGPYASDAAGFAAFVLLVSPVATALVVNVPIVGLPVGTLGGAYLGLGANVATMRFVADLDPGSSVDRRWTDGAGAPAD